MPRSLPLLAIALVIAGCASVVPRAPSTAPATSGKYYLDDGPGLNPPADLDAVPDAVPRLEPLHRAANRPYTVLGREYVPATTLKPYHERGIASWYGRKFHGQKTSIGETYDMYAMTAAHPTLPLPSYARVTNVATGKSVVVRVNDRGPFLHDRIIDLSYAAAHRVGIAQVGSGEVEVEAILPGAMARSPQAARPPLTPVAAAPAIAPPLAPPAEVRQADNADAAPLSQRARRLFGAARRVCKFCQRADFPRARAEPTRDGAGRSEDSPSGWTLSRLRRALSGPRRSGTRRGAHHASIRFPDDRRAALSGCDAGVIPVAASIVIMAVVASLMR